MATPIYRWLLWIPVLMIAALLYWTVALGLGALSLMAVTQLSVGEGAGVSPTDVALATPDTGGGGVGAPRDGFEPILVRIEESAEPEDVDDNAGCGLTDEVARPPDNAASDPSLRGLSEY
jgi:hypothetical protein